MIFIVDEIGHADINIDLRNESGDGFAGNFLEMLNQT